MAFRVRQTHEFESENFEIVLTDTLWFLTFRNLDYNISYSLNCVDELNKQGGYVALYIKNKFNYNKVEQISYELWTSRLFWNNYSWVN